MRIVFVVTFALVLAVPALAQDKPNPRREWQDGTWGDTERVSQYVGSVANSTATTTGTRLLRTAPPFPSIEFLNFS